MKDVDECQIGQFSCQQNSVCVNTVGSYRCECQHGFSGNGLFCAGKNYMILNQPFILLLKQIKFCFEDVDECELDLHNCSSMAVCTNSIGAFTCACKHGFIGNGFVCNGNKLFNFPIFFSNSSL
jgi:hypothetical protein